MIEQTAQMLERRFNLNREQTTRILRRIVIACAAALFVLTATFLVAFENLLPGRVNISSLQVNDVAPADIRAARAQSYISDILTNQRKQAARESVAPVYDPPDPTVARIQTQLARQILDFIDNVRRDPYATPEQKAQDLNQITALTLRPESISQLLEIDSDTWRDVDDQIINVLERVMRESIREVDLKATIDQLPTQVSVRFRPEEAAVIVAIVEDLVRANRFENPVRTEEARQAAVDAVEPVERSFEVGQIVVGDGTRIDELAYEALTHLGLLKPEGRRLQEVARIFLASIIVMVVIGLYIARFKPNLLYASSRMLTLVAVLFLLTLAGARFLGNNGQVYIYPTAVIALLYVTVIGPEVAIIGSLGMALLVGIMAGDSLEITMLILVGGLIGTLTMRRAERLNSYFLAGLMIGISNVGVIAIFNIGTPTINQGNDPAALIIYGLINGILAAAAGVAGMYILTQLFNLPTSLRLVELSQPNQPLLQRLLREAPGTYQHSLQVGNLAEQAANAIGANAELVRVAALYHDIGKVLNPAFFVENQGDLGNPHDLLNDPYRSADIIISHVTEGDEMARQYGLPGRLRDFIREHHGTTQVFVFYQRALKAADGDESAVDLSEFTYPGPKPQTRDTAVLMLADSCESAVRSIQPKSKKEIEDLVHNIIEAKRNTGQLDESGLTLNDLRTIHNIFVDILQAIFHPRINYAAAVASLGKSDVATRPASATSSGTIPKVKTEPKLAPVESKPRPPAPDSDRKSDKLPHAATATSSGRLPKVEALPTPAEEDDDSPLPDVPPLPRTGEHRAANAEKPRPANGRPKEAEQDAEKRSE